MPAEHDLEPDAMFGLLHPPSLIESLSLIEGNPPAPRDARARQEPLLALGRPDDSSAPCDKLPVGST